jgi:Uma2 family endonuclease
MNVIQTLQAEADQGAEPAWEVALLFPRQGDWSVEDYLNLQTNRLVEFSAGRIEVLPMPSDKHQSIVALIYSFLLAYAQKIGGKVLFAPLRVQLWDGKIREPDLVFLADANDPRRQADYWTGADLIVEVISPDDPNRDLITKRREYAQAGIPEYWIVDPRQETLTVLALDGDSYTAHGPFHREETATSITYPDLAVAVSTVFDVR